MPKMLSLTVGISVLALAGAASAAVPLSLTNAQMDIVTAGGSSSKSYDYSKEQKNTSYNDMKSNHKSKICDDFSHKEKSKYSDYSKSHKSMSYNDLNSSGKSKTYDGFSKYGSSPAGSIVPATSGHMFALK